MFNFLVWLITVACFVVALRATYLMAFERALKTPGNKRNESDGVAVFTPQETLLAAAPASNAEAPSADAELDEARQRNRDLVRELALLKEQLYASQSTAHSLQDRLDAVIRREAESNGEKPDSQRLELAALQSIYHNGGAKSDVQEQRQEALRQISELEGEMAGLVPSREMLDAVNGNSGAPELHANSAQSQLAEVRRELAVQAQANREINDENLRLREEVSTLEHRLQQQACDHRLALETQRSLMKIVAKLQNLTDETIALQRGLENSAPESAESLTTGTIQIER